MEIYVIKITYNGEKKIHHEWFKTYRDAVKVAETLMPPNTKKVDGYANWYSNGFYLSIRPMLEFSEDKNRQEILKIYLDFLISHEGVKFHLNFSNYSICHCERYTENIDKTLRVVAVITSVELGTMYCTKSGRWEVNCITIEKSMLHTTIVLENQTITATWIPIVESWTVTICDSLTGREVTGLLSSDEFASMVFLGLYNEELDSFDDITKAAEDGFNTLTRGTNSEDQIRFRIFP